MLHLGWFILAALAALAWFAPRLGDGWLGAVEKLAARFAERKRAVIIAVALTAVLTRIVLLWVFPVPAPKIHDEFSYLLAADTFAHGKLANPPHPMSIFFETFHVLQHPTYASMYPPAQGAVLALGQLLGHPWIGVLLSMAAMCAAITWMLQGWLPARWALLGAVLVLLRIHLCSYWLDSYSGGAVAATGGALVLGGFRRIIHKPRPRDAIAMAIGASLLANSRPFEGALFCIPVAVALVVWLFSQRSPGLGVAVPHILLPTLCVLGLTLLFMGYYNWRVTGDILLFPHVLNQRQYAWRLFFWQPEKPPLNYSNQQFDHFYNVWLPNEYHRSWERLLLWKCHVGWEFFFGIPFSIPVVTLPWVLRDRRTRLLLLQCLLCGFAFLFVYYFQPHYVAPLTPAIFALLVQGMRHLRRWQIKGRPVGIFMSRVVVLWAIARIVLLTGAEIRQPHRSWNTVRARFVKQLDATPDKHLVLVHYSPEHDVLQEWVYNAADIDDSKVVWAREIPGRDLTPLLDYFRGRRIWVVEADSYPLHLRAYQATGPSGLQKAGH